MPSAQPFERGTERAALARGEVHVWYAWTDSCTPDRIARYLALLDEDERARMSRLAFEHLRREFLLTRALCRYTLSRYANVAPQAWRFARESHGRPRILAPILAEPLDFNLSNTRDLVACVITDGMRAGVDVETVDRDTEIETLADACFSRSEASALRALPVDARRERFFMLWTLKESYIKARGLGLSIPLQEFSFDPDAIPQPTIQFCAGIDDQPTAWTFVSRPSDRGHWMALSLRHDTAQPPAVRWIEVVPDES